MYIEEIPVVLMRGGTSKCVILHAADLPELPARDAVLLRLMGSPHPRQIDGIGGATPLTSKVCIVGPPTRDDADIDYLFAQVGIDQATVDYSGNCGNCLSAVGVFAIDEGLVDPTGNPATVRIHNLNTGKIVNAGVPVHTGIVETRGDYAIPGVPGTAARISLGFVEPAGAMTGRLLPTGGPLVELSSVRVSVVDAGNPVAFVDASDLGVEGAQLFADETITRHRDTLEGIRLAAAELAGLRSLRSAGIPKIALVGAATDYLDSDGRTVPASSVQLLARMLSHGRPHAAFAVTAAVSLAAAALTDGTVVARLRSGSGPRVAFGHPAGVMEVECLPNAGGFGVISVGRTARRLFKGTAALGEVAYDPRGHPADGHVQGASQPSAPAASHPHYTRGDQ